MTEIDAVNKMLRKIGELPVPTDVIIDDLPDGHEAKEALLTLTELNRELQEQGYWFNQESWTFVPDTSNYITIPDNVISIKSTSANQKYRVDGGDLYSITDQTKIFTNSVELKTVFEVDFTDVPDVFASLVVYEASKDLHQFANGDSQTQKDLKEKIFKQSMKVDKEHMANKDYNLIKGSRVIDRTTNPTPLS